MQKLYSVFKMRFGMVLNYRMAAMAGVFTQVFFGLVLVMVYQAFYESGGAERFPMSLKQTITYIWLGQALLGLLPWNGDKEIQSMIRTGDFAYELVRPLDTYNYWFYRIVAQRLAGTLLRAVPLVLTVFLIMPEGLRMTGPDSLTGFLMFICCLFTGIILGGVLSNIITISVLFTIGDGVDRLLPAVVMMFSGMTVPLAFFPDWVQPVLMFLPFSGLVDGPYKFYLGIYGSAEFISILGHQVIWSLLLMVLGRFMLRAAKSRVVVQGG